MNLRHILLGAGLALLACSGAEARSAKRGVCAKFTYAQEVELIQEGSCWWYNWGNAANQGYQYEVENFKSTMDFCPMTWSANYSAENIRNYCKAHPEVKYLLGFNEPNFTNQANMTPAQAAAEWPKVQALAKELGLKLVAPALNYSANPQYSTPAKWMDEFVSLVGLDAFDFTALHNYGGFGLMKSTAEEFYAKYGKQVWITEWCYWPGGAGNVYVAPEAQISSMIECVEWLEQSEAIYRYSWFMAQGPYNQSNKPNYGLLANTVVDKKVQVSLTEQGKVYTHMWEFDPEYYHTPGTMIAATDYHARTLAALGSTNYADAPKPLEITAFNGGATLDYQFDVPEAGEYNIEVFASGKGEPERFDPRINFVGVGADGKETGALCAAQTLSLSGKDDVYAPHVFKVTLPAGKQTIRMKDNAPYQPSGIRIAALRMSSVSGIDAVKIEAEDATLPVDVFNTQGMRVRSSVAPSEATQGLPAGIYLVGGRKVLVK
ncbi:MAG: glycoside hydrolase family protein [Muribaculaceae bacterium]|nr:glycoside hydrolase family protein [Muribaculaceae bacterium]